MNRSLHQDAVEPAYRQIQDDFGAGRQEAGTEYDAFLLDPIDEAHLAECLMDYESAERLYHKSLLLRREELGDHHPDLVVVLQSLSRFLLPPESSRSGRAFTR